MAIIPTKIENDGIDHINVYSKGKTVLGRSLSNFAATPFEILRYGSFYTVEGFWYWLMTGDEALRRTSGWESKRLGEKLEKVRSHPTEEELLLAYRAKLHYNPRVAAMLKESTLPFLHYYVYGDKIIAPKEWQWTAQLWNELRKELKGAN